jgi:hypothetical protein
MPESWAEVWNRADGLHVPVAATLPDAAELLGADLAAVEAAAVDISPYRHADGSARWSVGELAARLGLAELDSKGRRRSRRSGDRYGPGRWSARAGAMASNQRRWAATVEHEPPPAVEDPGEVEDLAAVEDLGAVEVEDLAANGGQ